MARIAPVPVDTASEGVKAVFDSFMAARGNVPNMFRTLALVPELVTTLQAHFAAVLNAGTVELKLKELVVVRVSQLNNCDYCLASHTKIARQLGATDETFEELQCAIESPTFTEREKAAIAFAERLTVDSLGVDDAMFERLKEHFTDSEIVELAAVAGLFNYFNRFNNALQVEITR
ncbi:carboxymuconolactone decarboxylase family protein [bacterium]|nr:carboxymuconolactone decarboxylase family protein [bacterium]